MNIATKTILANKQLMPIASAEKDAVASSTVSNAIMEFIAHVPNSQALRSDDPKNQTDAFIKNAAKNAALAAGSLALPVGPLGWLTILPEMLTVWKIQAQLVADIATINGVKANLTRESMMYCLFKHSAAQAMRDIAVRVGERMLVRTASVRVLQSVAHKIGIKISQRAIGSGISRFVPLIGASAVAAYAYYDTTQVGKTAFKFFSVQIEEATTEVK